MCEIAFSALTYIKKNIGPDVHLRQIHEFACDKLLRELISCAVKSELIQRINVFNFVNNHDLVLFIFEFVSFYLIVRPKN